MLIQYVSFENLIEKTKKEYYQALMEGQKNRNKENESISKLSIYCNRYCTIRKGLLVRC